MPSRNVKGRPIAWRISQDKRVNDLGDPWAMLAYTWMIPSADNLGRIEGDPDLLASMIFPRQRDEISAERMDGILRSLHEHGLAYWYEVDGELFVQFPIGSWSKHQKLVGNMVAESDFPEPDAGLYESWLKQSRVNTSMNVYKPVLNEGKGRRREGEENENIVVSPDGDSPPKPSKPKSTTTKSKPNTDPRIKSVIDRFDQKHRQKFGLPAVIQGGKDGTLIKRLPREYDEDKLLRLVDLFFASRDPWIQERGYTIGLFISQLGKLVAEEAKSYAHERNSPARDDDLVER